MTRRVLSTLLSFFAICILAICTLTGCNNSARPDNPAATAAAQPAADATPADEIPPVDPIWDAMAKKQAHLDQVEKIRTGNSDAVSCQKAVPGPHRSMRVDTSHCNSVQLRIEKQAEHDQLFDKMVKTLRHD